MLISACEFSLIKMLMILITRFGKQHTSLFKEDLMLLLWLPNEGPFRTLHWNLIG